MDRATANKSGATRRDSTSGANRVAETLLVETLLVEALPPVASPALLKVQGTTREPADLHGWPLLYDLHWTTYWSHWFAHHGAGTADLSKASGFRLYSMMRPESTWAQASRSTTR